MRFILDTDTVSLFQRGHPRVVEHVLATEPASLAVTIITVEEQLRGRLRQVHRARDAYALVVAYSRLHETLAFFQSIPILDFDERAASVFEELRKSRIRIGTLDMRIAAIALTVGSVVVTRNQRDFGRVPSLVTEDWSV